MFLRNQSGGRYKAYRYLTGFGGGQLHLDKRREDDSSACPKHMPRRSL